MDRISTAFEAQVKLVPELQELLPLRCRILRKVQSTPDIGRRNLAVALQLTEREARREIEMLKQQGLLALSRAGASITEDGCRVLADLEPFVHLLSGRSSMERRLREGLGIQAVFVVEGDLDVDPDVRDRLGRRAARAVDTLLPDSPLVAVTGGSSVAAVGAFLSPLKAAEEHLVVAARGGIGKELGWQANTIAAAFAEQIGCPHRPLYLPDSIGEESYAALMHEPSVREMTALYDRIDLVVYGIGIAYEMASRRRASADELLKLSRAGAVAEAFGYYFDRTGRAVTRLRTVGIQLDQLNRIPHAVAVAAGSSKATALYSFFQLAPKQTILVTDEGAAAGILNLLEGSTYDH